MKPKTYTCKKTINNIFKDPLFTINKKYEFVRKDNYSNTYYIKNNILTVSRIEGPDFKEHFYTEQEMRKQKLLKLIPNTTDEKHAT